MHPEDLAKLTELEDGLMEIIQATEGRLEFLPICQMARKTLGWNLHKEWEWYRDKYGYRGGGGQLWVGEGSQRKLIGYEWNVWHGRTVLCELKVEDEDWKSAADVCFYQAILAIKKREGVM